MENHRTFFGRSGSGPTLKNWRIKHYLSLVKFSHTVFALPFAVVGFCLGLSHYIQVMGQGLWDQQNGFKAFLVLVCMVTARSAAMAFNRYLDRHFDAENPRTAIREIPAGLIAPAAALRFVVFNCILFVLATYFINPLCWALSPVALFVILFYSYTKRFTALCHLVLGLGLSLAPIGAYVAMTGSFAFLPLLFSLAVLTWVSGFDIIYALQDIGFDREKGLHSIPAWLGAAQALAVSRGLHLVSALCIVGAGFVGQFHLLYGLGAMVFVGLLLFQQSLVKPTDLSRVNLAFMTANGLAAVAFGLLAAADILWPLLFTSPTPF